MKYLGVLGAAIVAVGLSCPAQADPCSEAAQWRNINLPAGRTDDASDIIHAAAVRTDTFTLGWIFQTQEGQTWYRVSKDKGVPISMLTGALATFAGVHEIALKKTEYGGIVKARGPIDLKQARPYTYELTPCY
jgi:hypothetical protein